jgi:hypothetical protein
MSQQMPFRTLDSRPKPIIAIPWRWSWWLLYVAPTLPMALAAPVLMADPGKVGRPPGTAALTARFGALWPLAVMLIVLVPMAIWASRAPEFVVFKEGIKVNVKRVPPGRSLRDPWIYGFYSWDEVSSCRWLPYQPGVLSVHLAGALDRAGLPGTGSNDKMRVPPMIYLYRVPEPHRAAVEAAIRACGKWADGTRPS